MEDSNQVQALFAGIAVGVHQIGGTDLIAILLPAGVDVFKRPGLSHTLMIAIDRSNHDATTFPRVGGFGVPDDYFPGRAFNLNHSRSVRLGTWMRRRRE